MKMAGPLLTASSYGMAFSSVLNTLLFTYTLTSPFLVLYANAQSSTSASTVQSPTPTIMAPTTGSPPVSTYAASDTSNNDSNPQPFNYFFLFIAGIALLLIILVLYISQRRRLRNRKRTIDGRRALARDVESWGIAGRQLADLGVRRHDPGFDESGEAPPSYDLAAADKPPSLRHVERQTRGSVDEVPGLPAYDTAESSTGQTESERESGRDVNLQRPAPVRIAGNVGRWMELRRLGRPDETTT